MSANEYEQVRRTLTETDRAVIHLLQTSTGNQARDIEDAVPGGRKRLASLLRTGLIMRRESYSYEYGSAHRYELTKLGRGVAEEPKHRLSGDE